MWFSHLSVKVNSLSLLECPTSPYSTGAAMSRSVYRRESPPPGLSIYGHQGLPRLDICRETDTTLAQICDTADIAGTRKKDARLLVLQRLRKRIPLVLQTTLLRQVLLLVAQYYCPESASTIHRQQRHTHFDRTGSTTSRRRWAGQPGWRATSSQPPCIFSCIPGYWGRAASASASSRVLLRRLSVRGARAVYSGSSRSARERRGMSVVVRLCWRWASGPRLV